MHGKFGGKYCMDLPRRIYEVGPIFRTTEVDSNCSGITGKGDTLTRPHNYFFKFILRCNSVTVIRHCKQHKPSWTFSSWSDSFSIRTILALGYWVLGDIHRYWIISSLQDIFALWHPIRYRSDSSWHSPHASQRLFSSTVDLYSGSCNHLSGHRADMLLFIKHNHSHYHRVLRFTWYSVVYISLQINTLLCYTYWVLLLSLEANNIGYWVPCLVSFSTLHNLKVQIIVISAYCCCLSVSFILQQLSRSKLVQFEYYSIINNNNNTVIIDLYSAIRSKLQRCIT